jgi:hypothetical protein
MLHPCCKALSGPHGSLDLSHIGAISLDVLKQMAVEIESHVDR